VVTQLIPRQRQCGRLQRLWTAVAAHVPDLHSSAALRQPARDARLVAPRFGSNRGKRRARAAVDPRQCSGRPRHPCRPRSPPPGRCASRRHRGGGVAVAPRPSVDRTAVQPPGRRVRSSRVNSQQSTVSAAHVRRPAGGGGRGRGQPAAAAGSLVRQAWPGPCCFFIHTHKPKNNDCLSSLPN
jgi:hypothetical protein